MNKNRLLDEILAILRTVMEDKQKLEKIHQFLVDEIYEVETLNEIEIPEKYQKIVKQIAESIDGGITCHLNPGTLEVIEIPKNLANEINYKGYSDNDEEFSELDDDLKKLDKWEKDITFDPPSSDVSFGIMESFASSVTDTWFQDELLKTLGRSHPFANFKNIIDQSKYRQQWFDFKQKALEMFVFELLQDEEL